MREAQDLHVIAPLEKGPRLLRYEGATSVMARVRCRIVAPTVEVRFLPWEATVGRSWQSSARLTNTNGSTMGRQRFQRSSPMSHRNLEGIVW